VPPPLLFVVKNIMEYNNSMRMAVVQFYTGANVEKNWERAIAYLKEAAAEKVDLIVFPE
jgi:predicted amidohydrolase